MPATGPKASSAPPPPAPRKQPAFKYRMEHFWARVTEGLEVAELWGQFKAEARTSYRLYSREVDREALGTAPRLQRFAHGARSLFWAILLKLSPARRVILLVALVLLVIPSFEFQYGDARYSLGSSHFYAGILLLVLLVLEIGDRVTMKRDLEIAREIQLWLVPTTPPQVPGLDVAFVNRPANTVAGDYYDVFPRSADGAAANNDLLLAVADVAGKSLPAALLMATFQAGLKTLSASPCTLLELVAGLNRYVCAHSRGGLRFTTAFLGEFAPGSGELTYVNAGHNAPILLRSAGAFERLEQGGLPLGIRSDGSYSTGSTVLQPGDLLVIFTDGLVEAANEREEEFGEARLLSCLTADRDATAEAVVRRVMSAVEAFVGMAHQHDDITCLVARRT